MFLAPSRELDASKHLLINTREADVDRITMNVGTAQTNKVLTESLINQKTLSFHADELTDESGGQEVRAPCSSSTTASRLCFLASCRGELPHLADRGNSTLTKRTGVGFYLCASRCASPVLEGGVCTSVLHQEADDLRVTFSGSHMQSRPAVVVHGFHVHSRQEVPEDTESLI